MLSLQIFNNARGYEVWFQRSSIAEVSYQENLNLYQVQTLCTNRAPVYFDTELECLEYIIELIRVFENE